jgi:hypothetical protein
MDRKVGEERKPHEEYVEYLADNQWQDERPLVSRSVAVALDLVIVQGNAAARSTSARGVSGFHVRQLHLMMQQHGRGPSGRRRLWLPLDHMDAYRHVFRCAECPHILGFNGTRFGD